MNVAIIGLGYVGLVTGACLAALGHKVSFFDKDLKKLEILRNGNVPIYEPGLLRLIQQNRERIEFFDLLDEAVVNAEAIFITVGTPSMPSGEVDLRHYRQVIYELSRLDLSDKIIVNKSTVPVGTAEWAREALRKISNQDVEVVSNPEFLREGSAVEDFLKPDRVVIGARTVETAEKIKKLYQKLDTQIFITDTRSSELIKYASNAYLACQISFINSLSWLCEKVGANIKDVAKGMKLDKRIGQRASLNAGCGYGGSCFPKDVKGLISMAREQGITLPIVEAVDRVNSTQKEYFYHKARAILQKNEGKKVAVWGLAFKPGTDDIREAVSIEVIARLLRDDYDVIAYDPAVKELDLPVLLADDMYQALSGADLLIIFTEWQEFCRPDFQKIKQLMKQAVILDGRNIYDGAELAKFSIKYFCVGIA